MMPHRRPAEQDRHAPDRAPRSRKWILGRMPLVNEFTAVVERDQRWFVASCLEIPGANGQGLTKPEALQSLREAISNDLA